MGHRTFKIIGIAGTALLATAVLSPAQARGKADPSSFSGHGIPGDMKVNTATGISVVHCSGPISTSSNPATGDVSDSCRGLDGGIYTGTPVPTTPSGGSTGGGQRKP